MFLPIKWLAPLVVILSKQLQLPVGVGAIHLGILKGVISLLRTAGSTGRVAAQCLDRRAPVAS